MSTPIRWQTMAGGILMILAASTAGRAQQPAVPPPYPRHAVFRPAFNIPTRKPLVETGFEFPTKPVFLRGYSGYNYGRGPRGAFIETGHGGGYVQAVGAGEPVLLAPGRHTVLGGARWLRPRP